MKTQHATTTSLKVSLTGALATLALLASGCGQGLKFQELHEDGQENALTNGPDQTDTSRLKGEVSSQGASLKWDETGGGKQPKNLDFELKIPFGRAYKLASTMIDGLSPEICQEVPGILRENPDKYNDGEIPCGRILDYTWKHMLTVTVPDYRGSASGFDVKVDGVKVPVWLQRQSRAGNFQESDLTDKKTVTRRSSTRFAEDISLRYVPAGESMKLELCMNVPGGTVTGTKTRVSARASKRILGIKLSYGSDFDITPGEATFDYARGCVQATYERATAKVDLKVTEAPKLVNVEYQGLDIRIRDWFLRLVDKIVGFFTTSIKESVIKQVTRSANKIADRDIETGRWFTKIHGERLLEETSEKISRATAAALARTGVPATDKDLKALLKDNCRVQKYVFDKTWGPRLESFCADIVDKTELKTEIFAADKTSNDQGCYKYFARVHDAAASKKPWWATGCHFKARFSVKLPAGFDDYAKELKQVLAAHVTAKVPADWQERLNELKVDPYVLSLLLQRLEKEGIHQIQGNDWKNLIPKHLAAIRAQL